MTAHTDTNRLVAPNGVVIPPPSVEDIAQALGLDWVQWLDVMRGDGAAVWDMFYPRLVEAFDQALAVQTHRSVRSGRPARDPPL